MSDPGETTIAIDGLRLAARIWGPEDGAPVLAVHGWQDNAATFDLLAPRLDGLRIVAVDLAGHGLSEHRPSGVAYTFLDWTADLHALADALGWGRFSLLGHSLGAGLANAFAAAWPERVARIAAIDGFAPRTDEPGAAPARLAEHVAQRTLLASTPQRAYPDVEAAALRLVAAVEGLPLAGARLLAARGTVACDGGVTWRRDPRIQAGPPMRLAFDQIRAFLERVVCPVLLVRPSGGYGFAPERLALVSSAVRGLRLVEIDGGHHVHLEHPSAVADLVGPFLRGEN